MTDHILLQKGDLDPTVFSNDNTNNAGGVSLKLSPDTGNLLQKRNNGIYYGIEAPPDLANLYVSTSLGNDSNPGTMREPLKTIDEAFRRIPNAPQTFNVWLREGETFELTTYHWKRFSKINILAWGPAADGDYNGWRGGNIYFRGWTAKDYPRPILEFKTRLHDNRIIRAGMELSEANCRGIHIKVYSKLEGAIDDGPYSGLFGGVIGGLDGVSLDGCILEAVNHGEVVNGGNGYRNDALIRGNIRWINSKLVPNELSSIAAGGHHWSPICHSKVTKQVELVDGYGHWSSLHVGTTPIYEPIARMDEMKSSFKINKSLWVDGYNSNSKLTFGTSFNWDIVTESGL